MMSKRVKLDLKGEVVTFTFAGLENQFISSTRNYQAFKETDSHLPAQRRLDLKPDNQFVPSRGSCSSLVSGRLLSPSGIRHPQYRMDIVRLLDKFTMNTNATVMLGVVYSVYRNCPYSNAVQLPSDQNTHDYQIRGFVLCVTQNKTQAKSCSLCPGSLNVSLGQTDCNVALAFFSPTSLTELRPSPY